MEFVALRVRQHTRFPDNTNCVPCVEVNNAIHLLFFPKDPKSSSSKNSSRKSNGPLSICRAIFGRRRRHRQGNNGKHSSATATTQPQPHPASLLGCSRESGNFLTYLYFFVKCLYLTNAVGQIYLMERFVGSKVTFYGARVLADLVRGRDWQQSGHFPRVTFCDMEAKKLGKNHV